MEIGDIYFVDIPPSNGHEQAGSRPAIIAQTSFFQNRLPTVLTVPLTSQPSALRYPGTFIIRPDSENNLSLPSVALVFQLRVTDKKRVKRKLGKLSASDLDKLRDQLRLLLKL